MKKITKISKSIIIIFAIFLLAISFFSINYSKISNSVEEKLQIQNLQKYQTYKNYDGKPNLGLIEKCKHLTFDREENWSNLLVKVGKLYKKSNELKEDNLLQKSNALKEVNAENKSLLAVSNSKNFKSYNKFELKNKNEIILQANISVDKATKEEEQSQAEKDLENNTKENLENLDLNLLDQWFKGLNLNSNGSIKDEISKVLKGEYGDGFSGFFKMAGQAFGKTIIGTMPTIIAIICIALLYSILSNLTSGFAFSQTKEVTYYICYCAILILVMTNVTIMVSKTTQTIMMIKDAMNGVFPILLTFITLLGGVSASSVYKPMMGILATGIVNIICNVVLPLFIVVTIFCVVGSLSKSIKLNKLCSFLKTLTKSLLTGIFSVFVTYITFQGLTSSIVDNISVKTAKFAVQSYVPIVGGYLSDGFDLMLASIVLLKNSVGYVIMSSLLLSIMLPIIQIFVFSLGLRLASGIIEPISDERFSKMLYDLSKNITLLISIILAVTFMFLIIIMLTLTTFNMGAI